MTTPIDLLLPDLVQDKQSITADWLPVDQPLIDGVTVKNVQNVMKGNGYLTELYRRDWFEETDPIDQVFQIMVSPGGLSAWHLHQTTTDRLFVLLGTMKVVLFDPRPDSPTYGLLNTFIISHLRPQLVVVPPRVFHGVQTIGAESALLLNMVDEAYAYEQPDHWRLPYPHPAIPYRF